VEINIDVTVDLDDALRHADVDDIHTWLQEQKGDEWLAIQLPEDVMLETMDKDSIAEYACEHCEVVPKENI
tara:strand:+ start:51 stop:263 length:213 start_codon:yes stop_codon:yes gene_type:complete